METPTRDLDVVQVTRTPNIDLVLQRWPAVDQHLRANINALGLTTKQYEKEMGVMATTIRANQTGLAVKVLIVMGIVDYATSWSASALLKMSRAMKLDSFKARMAMETCQVKLAKEAALVALLDIGAVAMADILIDVRKSFSARIERKRKELLELEDRMNAEIERVKRFHLPVTNYHPPSKAELNRQCIDIENKRRVDQGQPGMTKNDYNFGTAYELHHAVVLQHHKGEYVRNAKVQVQLQDFAKYKIEHFHNTRKFKDETRVVALLAATGVDVSRRSASGPEVEGDQDFKERNGHADDEPVQAAKPDAEVTSSRPLPTTNRKRSLGNMQRFWSASGPEVEGAQDFKEPNGYADDEPVQVAKPDAAVTSSRPLPTTNRKRSLGNMQRFWSSKPRKFLVNKEERLCYEAGVGLNSEAS